VSLGLGCNSCCLLIESFDNCSFVNDFWFVGVGLTIIHSQTATSNQEAKFPFGMQKIVKFVL
jgi:hypothetical protein